MAASSVVMEEIEQLREELKAISEAHSGSKTNTPLKGTLGECLIILVVTAADNSTSLGVSKVTQAMIDALASTTDISDLDTLHEEYFSSVPGDDSVAELQPPSPGIPFGDQVLGVDPGMEEECKMSPEDISASLGFEDCMPPVFNKHRHIGGLTPWTDKDGVRFDSDSLDADPDFERIRLYWHQIAGVRSIVRSNFHKTKPSVDVPCGMLIADDVGLGKTFLATTLIAFLNLAVTAVASNRPLPPIIRKTSFDRLAT